MKRSLTRFGWCLALAALSASPVLAADRLPLALMPDEVEEAEDTEDSEALFDDSAIAPVAYDVAQPADGMDGMGMGMTTPAPAPRAPTTRRAGPTGSRQANIRLASVPNMFGDIGMASAQIVSPGFDDGQRSSRGAFDIPSAGGSRRVKIGENNIALPTDRVYVMYNHFHNALQVDEQPMVPLGPRITQQTHIDRYTAGFEKTFLDGLWSIEIRQPFSSSFDYTGTAFAIDGGSVGNMAVILKNLLYVDDSTAIGAGVAFDAPTGSDLDVRAGQSLLNFQNDAFHILPWVGFANNRDVFYTTGFAQLDLAANGNEVIVRGLNDRSLGYFNEQNLLYLDFAVGAFLFRDPYAQRLTSIALQGELHYTSTIQDTDVLDATVLGSTFQLANQYNRQDILNGTVALQFQIGMLSTFRVAVAAPLSESADERFFDAELQVQYNRRF